MLVRDAVVGVVCICGIFFGDPVTAQAAPTSVSAQPTLVYRREVFRYPAAGRPDPFRSLLGTGDIGVRMQDLALKGVVFGPDQRSAVAMIVDNANKRTHRLRVGQRLGGLTVVSIAPRRVDFLVQELGAPRRESLVLSRGAQKGS